MRRTALIAEISIFVLACSVAFGASPVEHKPLPVDLEERRAEALLNGSEGLVDLACTLFDELGGRDGSGYAFGFLQEAADAGNDAAALYSATYLRVGVGSTKRDEQAADRILKEFADKLRANPSKFVTAHTVARNVYSGKCGPIDVPASNYLTSLSCQYFTGPKPRWCT